MGFFGFGKRSKSTQKKPPNEMKSMEYYQTIKKKIQPLENRMVSSAVRSRESKKVDERISALNEVIRTYHQIRHICTELGTEYEEYFSQAWKPTYVEKFERELETLLKNQGRLAQEEQIHDRESVNLKERVCKILKEHPGILQTDVYKQFNPTIQSDIQSILYFMARDGSIKREKSGKTYRIFYNGK